MFITKCGLCRKKLELPDKCRSWEAKASPAPFVFVCDRCDNVVKTIWTLVLCYVVAMMVVSFFRTL